MADFDTIFEEETEFAEDNYYAVPDPIIIRGAVRRNKVDYQNVICILQ